MSATISKGLFATGLVIAILASTLASTVISMQYSLGPKGDKGDEGVQGLQGVQGPQGLRGLEGPEGPEGVQGVQGVQGPQGAQGLPGVNGTDGVQGPQGEPGLPGLNGTLPAGMMPAPAYDSGWIPMDTSGSPHILQHNLGTTEVFIYTYLNAPTLGWVGIHYLPVQAGDIRIWWCNLTDTTVWVYAEPWPGIGAELQQFRVLMWVISSP